MTISAERARAYRIFLESLDLEPSLRGAFLDQHCLGNESLRAEVKALLDVAERDEARTGALRAYVASPQETDLTGKTCGRFRLTKQIGEGGMGVVYQAERIDGVQQAVAVKLAPALGSAGAQARFEREAHHLARLEHPAIARLIDAGVQSGRAWIAMEFVRGERIDEYCARRGLSESEIVGQLVQIADAVVAAHRMLVIHSDIKPANVLVTADGVPKLIDFGISRTLRDAGVAAETTSVDRLFSPGFAAPEQIRGGPLTVATDVFGLGALAYRLLTGAPILHEAAHPIAYMQAITQRDVPLASEAASAMADPPVGARQLRGDLDAILCKALEREPGLRYPSAADLRADFERYLQGRPILARRQTATYRLGKFVRRNAVAVSLAAVLAVSLAMGGVVLERQSRREAQALAMAARRGEFLENVLRSADPSRGRRDVSVAELLDAASAELDRKLGNEPRVEASMLGLIAQTNNALARYAEGLAANDRQLSLLRQSGGTPLEIGQALSTRGELLRELGRWTEAEPVLRESVAWLRPLRSPAELCTALDLLGIVLAHRAREPEAEAIYREEIAIESDGDAPLRARRMRPYFALGSMFNSMGRYSEALEWVGAAVELGRSNLPPDAPDLLAFKTQYAYVLVGAERPAEAEPLLRDVIAAETRVLGSGHKDTLLARFTLADDLVELHRDAEAAALARPTAEALETMLGADNLYSLSTWQVYGTAVCNTGSVDEGLAVLARVDSTRRRLFPVGSWMIDSGSLSVGSCLAHAHRYSQAEPVLLRAVAGLEATRGPAHHRTRIGYAALRDLYLAEGRPDEAARWAAKIRA